jgi:hypothetical protein
MFSPTLDIRTTLLNHCQTLIQFSEYWKFDQYLRVESSGQSSGVVSS